MSRLHHVVVGAGAIGGAVAALLHESGARVTLVARGAHLEALRARGLSLAVGDDVRRVAVPVVGGPGEVAWDADAVVHLAVKSHQSADALDALLAQAPATTPLVCLQNGVSNERAALRRMPAVHGVCVMMPASHLRPGEVVLHSLGRPGLLDVGRCPTGSDEVDHAVVAAYRAAGFDSVVREDVMAWKHRKLLLNLGNGVDATCADSPAAEELVRRVRAEGEVVLAAAGVDVVTEVADRERRGDLLRPLARRDEAGSSTWQSLARGAGSSEVDHLNGEIVLLGRLHGVSTPANALVQEVTAAAARTRAAPGTLDAAGLLARLPASP
ncbi:ketopantoate reductase family protein [Nocardioides kribbensis]|uniref:ketopantoate reductase family protein n=1 Tax=Nocardioides kribbensis TaxID=305517 RepID=UPI0032DB1235